MTRLKREVGRFLLLLLVGAGLAGAGQSEEQSQAPDSLQAAMERLSPRVEDLEKREKPPTPEEMEELRPLADELAAAVSSLEQRDSPGAEPSSRLREARRLLSRVAALDLVRRSAEIRLRVRESLAREEPPTEEERAELGLDVWEIRARIRKLEEESDARRAGQESIREAENVAALAETVEALAEAETKRDDLGAAEEDPRPPTEQDVEAVESAVEELRTEIERVEARRGIRAEQERSMALRRARSILNDLLEQDLRLAADELLPEVERLESMAGPPPSAALDALGPDLESLKEKVATLEEAVKVARSTEPPPELARGRDILRRAALLDLGRAVEDLRPEVEAAESSEEPLTSEQLSRLLAIPPELRPRIQAARGKATAEEGGEEETAHTVVKEASDLLTRVETLVSDTAAAPEEPEDAPSTVPLLRSFRFYGSLRLRAIAREGGEVEVDGQTSRVGIRWEQAFGKKSGESVGMFARGEAGFNFLDVTDRVLTVGQSGRRDLEDDQLFVLRLAFLGVDTRAGRVSYGKQWSAYYDVGVFTDQLPFFAGAGTGVFAAGTDGGVSGTGRADYALQYRHAFRSVKYTLQMQIRNASENNRPIADTCGASFIYKWSEGFDLGVAFNKVLDGVDDPASGEPKEGDQALIIGGRYQRGRLYAAGTFTLFREHEIDDLGRWYGGHGIELYAHYDVSEKFKVRGAISHLLPEDDHPGEYRILRVTPGVNYQLTRRIRLVFLGRYDASTLSDGSRAEGSLLGAAFFYNF